MFILCYTISFASVWNNALCCFHLRQQRPCPPGFRRATSAQNPPTTISAPCWGFGQAGHQACPAIVHTQICPSAALSSRLLSWVSQGRTGPEASLPSPTAAHPTLSSAPALRGRPSQWLSSAPELAGEPAQLRPAQQLGGEGKGNMLLFFGLLFTVTASYTGRENLDLATKWRPRAWLPPTQAAPRQMPAGRGGGGAGAAQAHRPPPPRGTPGVVVRAGTRRGSRVSGRRAAPRSGSGTLTGLGLHPHPRSGALRALAHTLIPAPAPQSTEVSWKTEETRFSVSPKALSVNFRKSGHLRTSSPHSYISSLLFRFAQVRCWKWQLMNTCSYSTLACHLPQPLQKPTHFLLLSALCLIAVPSFMSCPGRLTSQFCTWATDHFGDCSLGATCCIGLLQDLHLCCKGG